MASVSANVQKSFAAFFQRSRFLLSAFYRPDPGRSSLRHRPLKNVAYGPHPAHILDLYPANGSGLHRLVVFVHGGGWMNGSKQGSHKIAGKLNHAGYIFASIDYRLVPQTDVAGSVSDAARAVAFLLDNAGRFGIDPSRFALMGHSSGGHVVALLGTDQHYLRDAGVRPRRLAAVIAFDGIFDVTVNLAHNPNEKREAVFGAAPAEWRRLSPINHIAGMQAHPTFCLLHEDTASRYIEQTALFAASLRAHGEKVRTAVAHGLRHGQLVGLFDTGEPMAPFTLDCLAGTL